MTINAMKSAFALFPERLRLINAVIKPHYAPLFRSGRTRAPGAAVTDHVVTVVEHPVVADALARIRDVTTPNALFRQNLERIGSLLLAEATEDLPTIDTTVDDAADERARRGGSPCSRSSCRSCAPGSGSSTPPRSCCPTPTSGSSAIRRDEETFAPKPYVNKLPESLAGRPVIVVDPMLATGGSLVHTVELLLAARRPEPIIAVCACAHPEGIERLRDAGPDRARRHRRHRRPPQRPGLHRPRPRRRRRPPVRPPACRSSVPRPRVNRPRWARAVA